MALMTVEREPEVARFIDSYKYDQDMANRRDRYGGGTSLPLNSDGYEDKQKVLREERHKDWLIQQDKPKDPVYYRVGTPEAGFPGLGDYERQRQQNNIMRQKEYNELLRKQRQMEQQKMDQRRHRSPPRPAQPAGPQVDYNIQSEQARAEERKAYQDYMGKYQYPTIPAKPPIDYEENRKILNEERKREYNQFMEKKAKEERYWAMRGRPVTPPGGLNIGNYDRQLKETAAAKKKEYKEMLDQQQREHMYLRARQEPEISVLDRNAQPSNYLANKPPPGPGYSRAREEPKYQTPTYWNEGRQAGGPRSFDSDASRSNQSSGIPMAFKTQNKSRPIPERPRHGQPPYYGEGQGQNGVLKEKLDTKSRLSPGSPPRSPKKLTQQQPPYSPEKRLPRSPDKALDRDWLRQPVRDDERIDDTGTPLAFKNDSQSHPIPERPSYGQPPYPGEGAQLNDHQGQRSYLEPMERSRSPQNQLPRSPEKPLDPDWLRVPLRDDERPHELGTPLAFKTTSHPQPLLDQPYSAPAYAQEGRKYENGPEGLFNTAKDRPRSQRSLDVERKYSPSKPDQTTFSGTEVSPRRTKNPLYKDSEEVNTKRREASKERQKEYNDYLKQKAEERRRQDDMRHQQQQSTKPTEIVKNPFYSSDDYEKFQREIQRKQGEDYRNFLAKKNTEVRNRDWNFEQNGVLELRGDDAVQSKQRELKAERQREYNNYMSQQRVSNPSRRHEFVDTASGPYGGLFHGLGEHGNRTEILNRERQQEYNDKLDQQYGKDRPSGRPNWVKESLPNDVDRGRSPMKAQPPPDQYQQMLDEKRREEASRRRYEDPEYQDRLAQGRDRGEAGQRYGY